MEEPAGGNELPKLCQPLFSSFIPAAHSALRRLLWPETMASLRVDGRASAEQRLQPVCGSCGSQRGGDSGEETRLRVMGVTLCVSLSAPDTRLAHENGETCPRQRGEERIHGPKRGDLTVPPPDPLQLGKQDVFLIFIGQLGRLLFHLVTKKKSHVKKGGSGLFKVHHLLTSLRAQVHVGLQQSSDATKRSA